MSKVSHVYISFYLLNMNFINRLTKVLVEVKGILLDISNAFDKVWHKDLVSKIKTKWGNRWVTDFLKKAKQRVVLNGQNYKWSNISATVPQGSILGPRLFLIYINDLFDNLSSNPKRFADDTLLFSVVHDVYQSGINVNDDLEKINSWAFQWKMSFNPDINKQAQEVIFSRKLQKPNHPSLTFKNTEECFWIQKLILSNI